MEEIRKKINEIDVEIVKFLNKRFFKVKEIAKKKREAGIKIRDEIREQEIMEEIRKVAEIEFCEEINKIYKKIIEAGVRMQQKIMVGHNQSS